ncbi:MAG: hypothetical protein WBG73_20825 [Coleofasciculaceae cyanobacterium]
MAIPPNLTQDSLGLTTPVGKKLFHALQDYSPYQVDAIGADTYALAVEQVVEDEFKAVYGYDFSANANNNNPFYEGFHVHILLIAVNLKYL